MLHFHPIHRRTITSTDVGSGGVSRGCKSVALPFRRMTFGKVNELGQFIREAEPEPDVKKSKGRTKLKLNKCHILI